MDRDGQVCFEVRDDGKGFDMNNGWQSSPKAGMGLLAMEERIRMLGGNLQVWSKKNQGTSITFTIPVAALETKSKDENKPMAAEQER